MHDNQVEPLKEISPFAASNALKSALLTDQDTSVQRIPYIHVHTCVALTWIMLVIGTYSIVHVVERNLVRVFPNWGFGGSKHVSLS